MLRKNPPNLLCPIRQKKQAPIINPNFDFQSISEGAADTDDEAEYEDSKAEQEYPIEQEDIENDAFKAKVKRFVEISKYFSSPMRKSASYMCENCLVSHPNPYRIEYKQGGVTTQHILFSNLTLEPVFVRLYKVVPDLEQLKFINLSFSRCKRIPPGLSFSLGFVYDDVNELKISNAKMIFVASRKSTTPCYQVCEIDLEIDAKRSRSSIKT